MIFHRGSRRAHRSIAYATKAIFEQLEERKMLTTIHGGDIINYIDATGLPIRVKVDGPSSTQVDVIGSSFNNGQFNLNDIPTLIRRPDGTTVEQLGGVGGLHGVRLIGDITGANESETDLVNPNINNVNSPAFGLPETTAPSGGANVAQMSSNKKGTTYAFNVIQQQVGGVTARRVELININYTNTTDNATGVTPADGVLVADLAPRIAQITGAAATTAIGDIIACDFLPSNDNLLYFCVTVSVLRGRAIGGGQPAAQVIPFLLTYNFAAGSVAQAVQPVNLGRPGNATEFISDQANGGFGDVAPTIQGFSINSSDRLVAMVTGRQVGGRGDNTAIGTATGLIEVDPNNPVFDLNGITPVTENGVAITDLHSLEVVPGDDNFVFGINGTAAATRLLHVNRTTRPTAQATNFGALLDPGDTRQVPRGFNLGDLTWNPALVSPFSDIGKKGVLMVEDTVTDELLVVDSRERFAATDIFAFYVTNSTADTSISISRVDPITDAMIPFDGAITDVGTTRVIGAQGGLVDVTANDGTGRAFVGARIISPTTPTQVFGPRRIVKKPSQRFGAFPNNSKYVYAGAIVNGDINHLLVGGMITGNVRVFGSANLLYAGEWLTGDAGGRSQGDAGTDIESNVYVGADLRNILTASTFGAFNDDGGPTPEYLSGFSVAVGGKLGQMGALDSYIGQSTYVSNTFEGNGARIPEVEDRRGVPSERGADTYFQGFSGGAPSLGESASFYNDTFETPQYVGTALNRGLDSDEVAIIDGSLGQAGIDGARDTIDYYAMALLAGQQPIVQLSTVGGASVTVFDPDGRLIDSDVTTSFVQQALAGHPFRFTADRPGAYRFTVSGSGNYTLRITNVADVALGGVVAANNVGTYSATLTPFRVHRGDAGAFAAGAGAVFDANTALADPATLPYTVDRGNLRSVDAPQIGILTNNVFSNWINIQVPRGSVGLMRATSPTGILAFNLGLVPVDTSTGFANTDLSIGGDYQLVDAANEFTAFMVADRSIGTVRMGSMTTNVAPFFIVNADRRGSDGTIDLIDDRGDFGTLGVGGPHIYTGPGGNVRYIRVAGQSFKSSKFGGGSNSPITLDGGKNVRLTDDSGTAFKLTATPLVNNTTITLPTDPRFLNPGQLQYLTYGIDDPQSAGVVLLNVTVQAPPNATAAANYGLMVEAGAEGTNGSVEIGTVTLTSAGRPFVLTPAPVDAITGAVAGTPGIAITPRPGANVFPQPAPSTATPLDIVFKGSSTIDVFSINAPGTIDSISNDTPNGEIVNVLAQGIGDIAADWIGISKSHTGVDAAAQGNAVLGGTILDSGGTTGATPGSTTPFNQQRNLIHVVGGPTPFLITTRARRGVGNIWVEGIIGTVTADSNGKQGKGLLDGIDGPIVATVGGDAATQGRIKRVDIGQGINFGGRGQVPLAGLFASQTIEQVVNRGEGRDIRGPIVVNAGTGVGNAFDGGTIGSVRLTNGAIISTTVVISSNFNDWQGVLGTITIPSDIDDPNNPRFDIGEIRIEGNGGIIGSSIIGPDIGPISVKGGFGVLNSTVLSVGDNTVVGIDTDGYGIRNTAISGSDTVNQVVARGAGNLLDANAYSASVRISAKKKVDPFFGVAPNETTDIYRFLGLTAKTSRKKTISASGVIENTTVVGSGNLDKVSAYQIRGRDGGTSTINFSNKVGKINVLDGTDEVGITAGALGQFTTGDDAYATTIAVAGPITRIDIGGTLRGSSSVLAKGPEGTISTLRTARGLFADVNSTVSIGSIIVGANLGSRNISAINNIDLLSVSGSIQKGTNVAFVRENGGILPFKKLGNLVVGGDIEAGATIRVKKLVKQSVGGSIDGNIIVG